jgi:hypothetical protein
LKETRLVETVCETKEINNTIKLSAQKSPQPTSVVGEILNNKNFSHNSSITSNVFYESKNEQSKNISIIGMIVLGAGMMVYAGYKLIIGKHVVKA